MQSSRSWQAIIEPLLRIKTIANAWQWFWFHRTVFSPKHLRTKSTLLTLTNACNLRCGGCNQHVAFFPKKEIFFISLEDLRKEIDAAIDAARANWHQPWFPSNNRCFGLFGGEPTVHPLWNEIIQLVKTEYADWPFVVFTNGRTYKDRPLPQTGHPKFQHMLERQDIAGHEDNVFWRIDLKDQNKQFDPALIAPIDILKIPDRDFYFEKARRDCDNWRHCDNIIYRGKSYFCFAAAPLDWLFEGGKYGWDLEPGQDTFQRSEEEIRTQARQFCYRCGFCLKKSDIPDQLQTSLTQMIDSPTLVSKTNQTVCKNPKLATLVRTDDGA